MGSERPDTLTLEIERTAAIPPVHHIVCCYEDDVALCGSDVSAEPFTSGDGEQRCLVCYDLDGTDACPIWGVCR